MGIRLREGVGVVLVGCALGAFWLAVKHLREQEFVGSVLLATTGLAVLRAGVELLRPTLGE